MEYIYTITNTVNGRVYVGRTNDPERRKKQHISMLMKGSHTSKMLQNDYDMYGKEVFSMRVVQEIPDSRSAKEAELAWMIALKTYSEYNKDDVLFKNRFGEETELKKQQMNNEVQVTEREKNIADIFKENVYLYCNEHKMNNHKFEQMCGLANGTINSWKSSKSINITTVEKIANATGIDICKWICESFKKNDISFYRYSITEMINQIPYDFVLRYLWLFVKDVYEDIENRKVGTRR